MPKIMGQGAVEFGHNNAQHLGQDHDHEFFAGEVILVIFISSTTKRFILDKKVHFGYA